MKQRIFDQCLNKEMKCKDGAKLLVMHEKSFLRLKHRYEVGGVSALMPQKPGPRHGTALNRTPKEIEELVIELGARYRHMGPIPLSEALEDEHHIRLNPSTIWRILKRTRGRYRTPYPPKEKPDPKLYCLDEPGIEMQLDGSYPFGRGRKIIVFSAVDDCSRWAHGRVFTGTENTEKAILFVAELIACAPFKIQRIRIDNKLGKAFDLYCAMRGIEVVRNDPYTPTQNGKVERYHRTLKERLFWVQFGWLDDVETLQYKLKLWLGYYNGQRRHGGYRMNRMTPNGKISSILIQKLLNYYFSFTYPQKVTGTLQQYSS